MKYVTHMLLAACFASVSYGQYVETTVLLPDSLSALQDVRALVYHSTNSTMYVGGYDDFVIAVDAQTNTKLASVPVGTGPHDVLCSDPPDNKVYCANGDSTVTVIDAATNQPIRTFSVEQPVSDFVYNEREGKVYCGNDGDTLFRVIDCAGDSVVARVPVSYGPRSLCYNPQLNRIYCAHLIDKVTVIDCAPDTVLSSLGVGGVAPWDICYDSASNCVYTANSASSTVSVIDCGSDSVTRIVPVGHAPVGVAAGPEGKVYCANYDDASISAISASDVKTVPACTHPWSLSYDPTNDKIHCVSNDRPAVTVLDAGQDTVLADIETGAYTRSAVLCRNPAGNSTYVGTDYDHVAVVGGESDTVDAVIQFGASYPGPLCYCEANGHLYCLDQSNRTLYVIDGESDTVLKMLGTRSSYGNHDTLVWSPPSNKVYFTNSEDGTVSILDCAKDSITASVATGGVPTGLACGAGKVYVSVGGGVTVIDGSGDSVRAFVPISGNPWSLCYDSIDDKAYVGWHGGDTLSVIDGSGDSVMASVPVCVHLFAEVGWHGKENKVYVAGSDDESLAVVDCTADTVVKEVGVTTGIACLYSDPVCNKVYGLDVDHQYLRIIQAAADTFCASLYSGYATAILDNGKPGPANRLYCTDFRTKRVTVVEGYKVDTVIGRITVGEQPVALAWNPAHSRVYVSNQGGSSITVIRDTVLSGVEDGEPGKGIAQTKSASVVRGALFMPEVPGHRPQTASLLDAGGRRVMNLCSGANDVSKLSPGVYFVREAQAQAQAQAVRKVVLTR